MTRIKIKTRTYEEGWLTKIPLLGYLFRFIKNNRYAIEKTLKTEKEAGGNVKKESFLGGLITIVSRKSFDTLKLMRKR